MTTTAEPATVCGKCGNAIWIQEKSEPRPCKFYLEHTHAFRYVCNKCGTELDQSQWDEFCPENACLLSWATPTAVDGTWKTIAATHLFCFRCGKEDKNIRYDWLPARNNSWAPHWQVAEYYGITTCGHGGAGPWMEDIIFCADCAAKTDGEEWLKQTIKLVLLRQGNDGPHGFQQLANEMRANHPQIKLEPSPWG